MLAFQKSEKRDVVNDCPARLVRIIHGEVWAPRGKNPGLVIRRLVL